MNISKNFIVFCLLILALTLNACSGLTQSDEPATRTWWLTPYVDTISKTPPDQVLSIVLSVSVVPGLDTGQILTLSDTAELNHYAAARWADNLPELVTSLVGRTLQASGRFEMVSYGSGGGSGRCDLQLEVREFFSDLSSSGQTTGVRVAIEGRFQCESGVPVALQLHASIPVHGDRMSLIVAAFQQAMDSVMKEMLDKL